MNKRVVIRIGAGTIQAGYDATVQIGAEGLPPQAEMQARLPAAPDLPALYQRWRRAYWQLGLPYRLEAISGVTNVSHASELEQCRLLSRQVRERVHHWLNGEDFRPIREKILEQLSPQDTARILLQTQDPLLQRLPWYELEFFQRYRQAEVGICLPCYQQVNYKGSRSAPVRILAVIGEATELNTQTDCALLSELPNAAITVLKGPDREAFNRELWDERGWDILFFAGHSQSRPSDKEERARGEIVLNASDRLTIPQLKHALKKAIERGLNTAIFNSCDGLGLANDLADLHIPQVLVMREPVPDQVAHAFLKGFLKSFAAGTTFYVAVREAREQLQGLETRFPCATWLPVIVQNLAETPSTWQSLQGKIGTQPMAETSSLHVRSFHQDERSGELTRSVEVPADREGSNEERSLDQERRLSWGRVQESPKERSLNRENVWAIAASLSAAALVVVLIMAMRFLGLLAPAELRLYNLLLRSRPAELPDPRLLIITNTQTDMDAMPSDREDVSLSDEALSSILTKLTPLQPKIIGLDIYRDFSADNPRLAQQLQETNNLIAICKAQTEATERISPPPEINNSARIGLSDFVGEGPYEEMVRRHLVRLAAEGSMANSTGNATGDATAQAGPSDLSNCQMAATFSTAIAFRYLKEVKNIPATDDNVLAGAELPYIRRSSFGGYAGVDTRSDQILLNYRIVKQPKQMNCGDVYETPATCLSVSDLLARSPDELRSLVENKIVLIGTTAAGRDPWITPYTDLSSAETSAETLPETFPETPGVFLQAQMVSQLVSAGLEERSLMGSLTLWQEVLWTCGWALVGGGVGLSVGFLKFGLRLLLAEGLLVLATWVWLSMGSVWVPMLPSVWVPLLPSAIAVPTVAIVSRTARKAIGRQKGVP